MNRIWAIGDIHGCYTALETLINQIKPFESDILVFLGDYIDRGPATKQVIDFLISLQQNHETYFIKGNHEIFMLTARLGEDRLAEWLQYGGDTTLNSYSMLPNSNWVDSIPNNHWDFLEATLPHKQIGRNLFVHAGLTPQKLIQDHSEYELFWKKYHIPEKYSDDHYVITGHTSRKDGNIANFGHSVCIDTYAYGGMWLTGLEVNSGHFIQTNEKGKVQRGLLR